MKGRKPQKIVGGQLNTSPRAPHWLGKNARLEWNCVVPILIERAHLTDADLGTLAAYAGAVGQLIDSTQLIDREGMVIQTDKGPRKHPAIAIQINARNQVRQLAAELGLTPVSRSRPSVRDQRSEDDSASELGV